MTEPNDPDPTQAGAAPPPPPPGTPFPSEPPSSAPPGPTLPPAPGAYEPPPPPKRSRGPLIAAIAGGAALVVVIVVVALVVAGGSGAKTFSAHGFSFNYPGKWRPLARVTNSATTGTALTSDAVGIDGSDLVQVATYHLNVAVTADNFSQLRDAFDQVIQQTVSQANGSVLQGATEISVGGLRGLRYQITATNTAGVQTESRVVLAFRDMTEYFLNCQHVAAYATEIESGCDQIMQSFKAG